MADFLMDLLKPIVQVLLAQHSNVKIGLECPRPFLKKLYFALSKFLNVTPLWTLLLPLALREASGMLTIAYGCVQHVIHRKLDQSLRKAHIFCLYVSKERGIKAHALLLWSRILPTSARTERFFFKINKTKFAHQRSPVIFVQ